MITDEQVKAAQEAWGLADEAGEDDVDELWRAALEAADAAAWQPIETAPKDGTVILLAGGELSDEAGSPSFGGMYAGYWSVRDNGIWRIKAGFGEIAEVADPLYFRRIANPDGFEEK